jgi:hypothetical protein
MLKAISVVSCSRWALLCVDSACSRASQDDEEERGGNKRKLCSNILCTVSVRWEAKAASFVEVGSGGLTGMWEARHNTR